MFIALDLETTGFDPEKNAILEFGAVKFDLHGAQETLHFLFNPGLPIPELVTHITNIREQDIENAPAFEEKRAEIAEFIGDLPIVGHNIQFDTTFLRGHSIPLENHEYDTFELAGLILPDMPSYSLEILSRALNLTHTDKHRALDDAIASMELFLTLLKKFQALPSPLLTRIQNACTRSTWPLGHILAELKHNPDTPTEIIQPTAPTHSIPHLQYQKFFCTRDYSALFEHRPPYDGLTQLLLEHAGPESYIAVPHTLLRELSHNEHIALLDTPEHYLSPKKLEKIEQKATFTPPELRALIKYLIWSEKTTTGHLGEVQLFHEERQAMPLVQVDPENAQGEPYPEKARKKDETAPSLCTYNYLISEEPAGKELVIVDFERFLHTLYYTSSHFITLEQLLAPLQSLHSETDNKELLEALETSCTILFGIIGMIFEKTNDQSPYTPRSAITPQILNDRSWLEAKAVIQNLISRSQELAPLTDNPYAKIWLKEWKKQLTALDTCFKSPDLDHFMLWIEQDRESRLCMRCVPCSLKEQLKKILDRFTYHKFISEIFSIEDNADFLRMLYGLDETLALHPEEFSTLPEIHLPQTEIHLNQPIPDHLLTHIRAQKGGIAILAGSRAQIEAITLQLAPLKDEGIRIVSQATGSIGKIGAQYAENPENSLLILTPQSWKNFPHPELIRSMIIDKIPFLPPSDPFITSMSRDCHNAFTDFQIPYATLMLLSCIRRLCNQTPPALVFLLDTRLTTRDYGKAVLRSLKPLLGQ